MSKENQNLKQRLIQGLNQIPESWALTPLLGSKAPYRENWQQEPPISRSQLEAALRDGEIVTYTSSDGSTIQKHIFPQGYGIRTGLISGGIIAVDLDGSSAHRKMLELSGGEELPKTIAFTSGRPGRRQALYGVPEQYRETIQTKKFKTGITGDDGKPELLELRWDGCQSVLPPSVHPTTGQYQWVEGCTPWECEIAEAPLWLIELMLVDQPLASQQQQPSSGIAKPPYTHPHTHNHTDRWTDIDWALSYLAALAPDRADDYDEWLAVGMALHSVDDSLLVEWERWSQQSPKYKPGVCQSKWKSFKRSGVSIGSLAHMAKQDGWRSPFEKRQSFVGSGGDSLGSGRRSSRGLGNNDGNGSDSTPPIANVTLVDRIKEILHHYEQESLQVNALMDLATAWGRTYNEISQLVRIIRAEGDLADEVIEAVKSFQGTLKSCRKRLDIKRYLEPALAEPLLAKAAAMPTAPEYLFNTLLPASASRIGTAARVIINPEGGYKQPCIFWAANVAHSGQAKTPPQQEIINSLEKMEAAAKELHDIRKSDYQQQSDKDAPPPVRQRRLLNNVTTSTKIRIHEENPRGLLEYIDELVADYSRLNQYKSGKGDDLQLELSFWNGAGGNYDRTDVRLFLARTAFSKTGTYQWDTLARLMADDVNFIASGYSARFLYCSILDAPLRYLDLLSVRSPDTLNEKLQWLYGELEKLPEADYLLSHEAKVLFQGWNHALVNADIEEVYYGLSLVYAKIESYTARIALWLHLVNAVLRGEKPAPVISGETMQHAIEIGSFYLWQHKLIHAHNSPTRKLEGIFLKVQTQAEKFFAKTGMGVGASFLKTRINALKSWVVEKIRSTVFKTLASSGHGRIEGDGADMVYIPNTVSGDVPPDGIGAIGGIGDELVEPPIAKNAAGTKVQSTISEVGDVTTPNLSSRQQENVLELDSSSEEIHQFTNSSGEPITVYELQSIGDHQSLHQSPIEDPLGGERLNDSEMAAWYGRLSACQTLDDAINFYTSLDALSPEQRHQFESSVPEVTWTWFWNLPEVQQKDPDEVPEFLELEPPEPESMPEQTLEQLKALLLACDSLVQLNELKQTHKKTIVKAYDSMTKSEQSHIDALAATSVPHRVFKYLGDEIRQGTERLMRGTLVYVDPQTQVRATACFAPVWAINGVSSGWKQPIHVSLSLLQEVVKAVLPEIQDGGQQMGLI